MPIGKPLPELNERVQRLRHKVTVVLQYSVFAREDDGDVAMPIFESRQCGTWGKGNALTRVVMP